MPSCAAGLVDQHHIGGAQKAAFSPSRVGLIIAGFEVPHTHVHVFGADNMSTFDFANASAEAEPAGMDDAATALRGALRAAGHGAPVAD